MLRSSFSERWAKSDCQTIVVKNRIVIKEDKRGQFKIKVAFARPKYLLMLILMFLSINLWKSIHHHSKLSNNRIKMNNQNSVPSFPHLEPVWMNRWSNAVSYVRLIPILLYFVPLSWVFENESSPVIQNICYILSNLHPLFSSYSSDLKDL
jgi:hypothetical protein